MYVRFRDTAGTWSGPFSDSIVLDTRAPSTTATPSGGTYTSNQTITLTCGDGTGSGCHRTYYTLDGSNPTTASNVYRGPLLIASTTTLKYFSKDLAGNTAAVKTQSYTVDTTIPTGTIAINSGASYTQTRGVTLTLSCSDNACHQMQFSHDNVTWSNPAAFSVTKNWTLTAGDGEKTVYVKYRDSVGNWSNPFSDTIVLDTTAPVTTASPAGGTYTTAQTVTLTCGDGLGSGCDKTYYTTDGTVPTTASNVYGGPLLIASTATLKYFSKDLAGNTAAVKTQSYKVDTTIPSGTIVINNGAAYTRTRGVTLTLSCSDNACFQMQFSNDNVTWSNTAAFSVTKNWTLTAGDGEKTVYVKYRDNIGNWSEFYSDAITLDATRPTNGTLTAAAGKAQVALSWTGFSDALSGLSQYQLVYNTGSSPSSCSAGTPLYTGNDLYFLHEGLTPGTRYFYRLCAQDLAGNTSTGARANATPN